MNKPLTTLSDIFVRRIETRRKGMRTDWLGWWVLEENNRGRVLWRKGRQIKMWYSNTGSFPGVIRRALLFEVGDTLIVREVDQGQAKSLPNADFTGYNSAHGRVNSTSLHVSHHWPLGFGHRHKETSQGVWKNNGIRGDRCELSSHLPQLLAQWARMAEPQFPHLTRNFIRIPLTSLYHKTSVEDIN